MYCILSLFVLKPMRWYSLSLKRVSVATCRAAQVAERAVIDRISEAAALMNFFSSFQHSLSSSYDAEVCE
jgi:hypothetical protein